MTRFILTALAVLALPCPATAETFQFRDSSGRLTSTVTRDSNGTFTIRDGAGRLTGTATRDSNGTTTYHDSSGRIIGTGGPTTCAIAQHCMDSNGKWK